MFDEFSKNYHPKNDGKLKGIEKIYLQRLEGNCKQSPFYFCIAKNKRKNNEGRNTNNRIRDASDALFFDENFDENDIIF